MFFYISIRPVCTDGKRLLTPKYMLKDGFSGLIQSWRTIATRTKTDSRYLYEIEVKTEEYRDVILEGLQMWGCHLKTDISAVELFNKLTNRKDASIKEGKLDIPNIDKEEVEGYESK